MTEVLASSDAPGAVQPQAGVRTNYYREHIGDLPRRLREAVPQDELKRLHARSGARHAAVAIRHTLLFVGLIAALIHFEDPLLWIPLAAVQGTVILGFIILLHDNIHGAIFAQPRPRATRVLALLYAFPSAIAASQFERWHLDHHRGLGSAVEDPKRHRLSPSRNARWLKLLYMTPVLFLIYARAAGSEAKTYAPALQRRIRRERLGNVTLHLLAVAALWWGFDGMTALRAWIVPLFGFFPMAFMINRLGQHYWIDPTDPAKWGTRVDSSPLVRFLFLNSNYHLEHHYFPSVPLYRLRTLNHALRPFWARIGHPSRTYPALLWGWFVRNGQAHTDWS